LLIDEITAWPEYVDGQTGSWGNGVSPNLVAKQRPVGPLEQLEHTRRAIYDFPAEHWKHLRTSNVIESSFATVRHRTVRSKGRLSNRTALAMIFKLTEAAEKTWRRLDSHKQLPKVILGVKFTDGMEILKSQAQAVTA
jgi:hypothetical protein